jgi:uncharacterized protein (TIGR03382 family)
MRVFAPATVFVFVVALASSAGAEELQNDSFTDNGSVGFQAGFVTGEIAASRFVAPQAGLQLLKVHLLFGGATTTKTVTLRVWDDTAGTDVPGAELFSGDFQLMGSNTAMQELDTTPGNVTLTQQFRVGIEFQHDGAPSVARDDDGTIAQDKNFIMASGGLGWKKSSTFGLTGDWIIRATIPGAGGPDGGATGGSCSGNADCPVGNFCDVAAHTCTFECRTDDDCGGGSCNSLGQCVGGDGGGCCQSGGGASGGAFALALLVLAVVGRRRRC